MNDSVTKEWTGLNHPVFMQFKGILSRVVDQVVVYGCGPSGTAESVRFLIVRVSSDQGEAVVQLILRAISRIEGGMDRTKWLADFKAWPEFMQIYIERESLLLELSRLSLAIEEELNLKSSEAS